MAAPIIDTTQSVLYYPKRYPFVFQPWAANSPDEWQSSPLPPGAVLDTETGAISVNATSEGVYSFSLIASNADGASDAVMFCMGIGPGAGITPSSIIELFVDLQTRQVSLSKNFQPLDPMKQPLFAYKRGDDLIFHVVFLRSGVAADLDIDTLKFTAKEYEPEGVVLSGNDWEKLGTGVDAAYRLYVALEGAPVDVALSDNEKEDGTQFIALAELEWTETNGYTPTVGPDTLRGTSLTFGVQLIRDLTADV